MATPGDLTREAFDRMAEAIGLDPRDSHMERLFLDVRNLFTVLARLDEMDVEGEEPALIFSASQGG